MAVKKKVAVKKKTAGKVAYVNWTGLKSPKAVSFDAEDTIADLFTKANHTIDRSKAESVIVHNSKTYQSGSSISGDEAPEAGAEYTITRGASSASL